MMAVPLLPAWPAACSRPASQQIRGTKMMSAAVEKGRCMLAVPSVKTSEGYQHDACCNRKREVYGGCALVAGLACSIQQHNVTMSEW